MTQRNNDDIANALHGLASGEHVEAEPVEGSGTGQAHHLEVTTTPPAPAPPPAAVPPAARPPAVPFRATPKPVPPSAASSGAAPGQPRGAVPPMRPRPQPQPQPPTSARATIPAGAPPAAARPTSPVQPGRAPRNTVPPGARPAPLSGSPNLTPPGGAGAAPQSADVETTNVQPVDEDDRVIVPAAPLSAFGPRAHARPAARVPMFKTPQFRRTAIPVLLTTGVMLLVVAGLKFVVDPDSVLSTLSVGTCLALAGVAVVLLGIAALNMALVRHQLAAAKSGTSARA